MLWRALSGWAGGVVSPNSGISVPPPSRNCYLEGASVRMSTRCFSKNLSWHAHLGDPGTWLYTALCMLAHTVPTGGSIHPCTHTVPAYDSMYICTHTHTAPACTHMPKGTDFLPHALNYILATTCSSTHSYILIAPHTNETYTGVNP